MKKIILGLVLFLLLFVTAPVHAVAPDKFEAAKEKLQQKVEQRTSKLEGNLKERAIKEVDRRITSLNGLIEKINRFKKLSTDQKSTIVSQIQAEITNLTALKAKIEADTDSTTLKTDVRSITKGFRVYAFFVPKIHILVAADVLDSIADKMSSLAGKLETRIGEAKAKGENTASLSSLLVDMKAKITDTRAQAKSARDLVIPLTPSGYPGNKTTLQSARTKLAAGHRDLQLARQDAERIIQGLRKITTKPTPAS